MLKSLIADWFAASADRRNRLIDRPGDVTSAELGRDSILAATLSLDASYRSEGKLLRLDVGDGTEEGRIERDQFPHRTDAIG